MWLVLIVICFCLQGGLAEFRQDVRKFPDGFLFGTATASYQVEGAWDEDGKSENIWDRLTHNQPPCVVRDCTSGDYADNSYHNIARDVEMMRELGLDFYRMSFSWTRLLPTSFPDKINDYGVAYYNNLINEMLKYNIQPMVTLYHWDLPQKLQDMGGWVNPNIIDWFADYARVCFELFGDRVKYWMTINELREVCYQGYGTDEKAPRLNISGIAEYMCAKNILLAHAKAYHIYNEEFKPMQGGQVGIAFSAQWYEPENPEDKDLAEEFMQFEWGTYIHPIYSDTGDFPQIMKDKIAAKSAEQGFLRSRLPEFSVDQVDYIRGTSDFFGLNHYTTFMVYRNESVQDEFPVPSMYNDLDAARYQPSTWIPAATPYLKVVPEGFYKLLTKIRDNFNNPPIIITENGFSTFGGLEDDDRIYYYSSYISAMLDAIEEGSNIKAYTAWSLMDNFEWMHGYRVRFGLYETDFASKLRTRTPRKSAFFYKQLIRTRQLDLSYVPDTRVMSIDEGH